MSFYPPPQPYPRDRYTGDGGEVSARLRPAATAPDSTSATSACHYLSTGASTGGDFGLYRWEMAPGAGGPPAHFHRSISESFYVLSGTIALFDGDTWVDGRPGDFLYVPEGGHHGFHNAGDEPASMLIIFAPGAPREPYFEGLAHLALGGARPGDEVMAEFYRRHDTFWVQADRA